MGLCAFTYLPIFISFSHTLHKYKQLYSYLYLLQNKKKIGSFLKIHAPQKERPKMMRDDEDDDDNRDGTNQQYFGISKKYKIVCFLFCSLVYTKIPYDKYACATF